MTGEPLHVPAAPCASCPYRADHPPGVWDPDEYAKLPTYDDGNPEPEFRVFHCHQENATGVPTVCTGWLHVHADSVAVRLAVIHGTIPAEAPWASCPVPLHASGADAAEHGLSGCEAPDGAARAMVDRLLARGVGHLGLIRLDPEEMLP